MVIVIWKYIFVGNNYIVINVLIVIVVSIIIYVVLDLLNVRIWF